VVTPPIPDPESAETVRARADAARAAGPSGQVEALRLYASLRWSLDPRDAADADRILWAAGRARGRDDGWSPLVDAVLTGAEDPVRRATAAVVGAQLADHRGDAADAERRYLAVLESERGTGSVQERAATLNLVRVLLLQGRDFEALVLGHRAQTLMRTAGDLWGEANACLHRGRILLGLGDLARAEEAAEGAAVLTDRVGPPRDHLLRLSLYGLKARILLEAGDARGALAEMDRADACARDGDPAPLDPRLPIILRADAMLVAGDPSQVEERLAPLAAGTDGPALDAALVLVRAAHARGTRGLAATRAVALLDALDADGPGRPGPGRRLALATALRRILHDEQRIAARASAIAAAAMLERIAEIDALLRRLPEASRFEPEHVEILAMHRRRFLEQQAIALAEVARMLELEVRRDGSSLVALAARGEFISICAWCRRIRSPGGPWLPVEHYLPPDYPLRLTHGICETCATTFVTSPITSPPA
jgi:ATP/maltotriose-dependent transcriptional regulator MalT